MSASSPPSFLSVGILALAGLAVSTPAHAGGFGIVTAAGGHVDRIYSYKYDESAAEYDQFVENQFNANVGTGLEFVLGDKDNKIIGVFRGYYLSDSPQKTPGAGDTFAIRETSRSVGMMDAGLSFGFLGDPGNIQMTANVYLGSGFLTTDYTPFIYGEAGVGGTWMAARHVQVVASVAGGSRYRRRFFPTTSGYLGVRYLFD